jgi:hypothetical protein
MKIKKIIALLCVILFLSCKGENNNAATIKAATELITPPQLTIEEANRLALLPLTCMDIEYPNKLNQSLQDSTAYGTPKELHPAFYGCYDWHSAVHGHWSLVRLLKQFPKLNNASEIREKLSRSITKENIAIEVAYFKIEGNASYERTYGWAWVLKLAEELHNWDDPLARALEENMNPLTTLMTESFIDFLPKLSYPIRVGEHTNTAFALSFALDYARLLNNKELEEAILTCVERFYIKDTEIVGGCPLEWEPSGFDFLSPCLEEANLVSKVLPADKYKIWLQAFLPKLLKPNFSLVPGKIKDRTDGKLVHLDGLNFSRAWCLYGITKKLPELEHLKNIAASHLIYSLPNIVDENYGGTHWLGSFAIYSLNKSEE